MRMILKIFVIPLRMLIAVIIILGNLLIHISSYAIGIFLWVLAGCGIFCAIDGKWTQLAILAVMAIVLFLILCVIVILHETAKAFNERLGDFLRT